MSFLDRLARLVTRAQDRGVAIWNAYADTTVDVDEPMAVALLATQIQQFKSAAANLASVSFAAKQSTALQRFTPVSVIVRPDDDLPRLQKAAKTVLQVAHDSDDPKAIVARLVRSESLNAAAEAISVELALSFYAEGYRRQTNPGACERCVRWAKGGRIFKPDTYFPTHPGCSCMPDPAFTSDPEHATRKSYTI